MQLLEEAMKSDLIANSIQKKTNSVFDDLITSIPVFLHKQLVAGGFGQQTLSNAWGVSRHTIVSWTKNIELAEEWSKSIPRFPIDFRADGVGSPLLYWYLGPPSAEQLQSKVAALKKTISELNTTISDLCTQIPDHTHWLVENKAFSNKMRASNENKLKLDAERKRTKELEAEVRRLQREKENVNQSFEYYRQQCKRLKKDYNNLKVGVKNCKEEEVKNYKLIVSEKWLRAVNVLRSRRYKRDHDKTDYLYGLALSVAPGLSRYAAEQVFVFASAVVLNQIGMLEEIEDKSKMTGMTPKADILRTLFREFAITQYCFIIRKISHAQAVGMAFDKSVRGTTMNKVNHKIIVHYGEETEKIEYYYIDFDGAEGMAEDCGAAVAHTIKYRLLKKVKKIAKIGGDNSGGDSGKPLATVLKDQYGLMDKFCPLGLEALDFYKISNCVMHNHNLMLVNAFLKVLGLPGIEKRNILQAIHGMYDLEKNLGPEGFRMINDKKKVLIMRKWTLWKSLKTLKLRRPKATQ